MLGRIPLRRCLTVLSFNIGDVKLNKIRVTLAVRTVAGAAALAKTCLDLIGLGRETAGSAGLSQNARKAMNDKTS